MAIMDGGVVRAELSSANNQTHTKHLMTMIDTVCSMGRLEIAAMDGFAVTQGPGSFTGLRIGISTIKALAWSLKKPVVGISSLDALARQCIPGPYPICTLLDARKQQVYCCRYHYEANELKKDAPEQVLALADAISGIRDPFLFVGNGASLYEEQIINKLGELAYFAGRNHDSIRASTVAGLSLDRFRQGQTDEVALLVPHYIRKSDAEMHRKPT